MESEQPPLEISAETEYLTQTYWAIFSTGGRDPRFVRTEPRTLQHDEVAMKFELRVPVARKKMLQSVRLTMPELDAHVANIEISVPSAREET